MTVESTKAAIEVFYAYSHKDEKLRDQLEKSLHQLKRDGLITGWHDRKIGPGKDWAREVDTHLNKSGLILLLVSSDFLDSDYCYDHEMQQALEKHYAGEACVIPVILRPCDWQHSPLGKLQALPRDGKAVTDWRNRDKAFLDVTQGIRKAVEEITGLVQVYSPPSERLHFIDVVQHDVASDARIFDTEFTQTLVVQIACDLSDAQFNALYSLGKNYRAGSQGITKSFALEQIGGKPWEATEIFEALVRFGFLALSSDPRERNDPDPGYGYGRTLFFGFKNLMHFVEKRGDPEADWWLASPDNLQAEERYKMEINRRLSEMEERLKHRASGSGAQLEPGEGFGDVQL